MIREVNSLGEFAEATSLGQDKLVLVEVYAQSASNHADAPRDLQQVVNSADVPLVRVDLGKVEDVARVLDITTVPSVAFIKNGRKIDTVIGDDARDVETKLRQHCG
ncbi:hypothetical protein BDF19DRAFT_420292 [Syncephalis fuscata]|nr:hypothetical protein BDF19DRAFT_420292 [Syncephalis fuscata]